MNQKEYDLIASVFKKEIGFCREYAKDTDKIIANSFSESERVLISMAWRLTYMFEEQYPKTFDRYKFLTACGIKLKGIK